MWNKNISRSKKNHKQINKKQQKKIYVLRYLRYQPNMQKMLKVMVRYQSLQYLLMLKFHHLIYKYFYIKGHNPFEYFILILKAYIDLKGNKDIVKIQVENKSVSKQHCVIQLREIKRVNSLREVLSYEKSYVIDLDSTNGTQLNEQQLESENILIFGKIDREFVLIKS
ncbi:unnamed protein product [Paramecium primaurelia]|uniref:FHA domain-containing protein n=1 Tax=Paramecium primaurelia TaxID=5886 RepID=A0A8S1PVP9_PARPR|nr:unnamed protein product [Paramecium primaurelia]